MLRVACRDCGRSFVPDKPWWRMCPRCARSSRRTFPAAVRSTGQIPGQLSMRDTVEWQEATSPNVVRLRTRRRG